MYNYQNYVPIGMNLKRQQYGPLDVSNVFFSKEDLKYYITYGKISSPNVSSYWRELTPYPYPGQLITLIDGTNVSLYIIAPTTEYYSEDNKLKLILKEIPLDNLNGILPGDI